MIVGFTLRYISTEMTLIYCIYNSNVFVARSSQVVFFCLWIIDKLNMKATVKNNNCPGHWCIKIKAF